MACWRDHWKMARRATDHPKSVPTEKEEKRNPKLTLAKSVITFDFNSDSAKLSFDHDMRQNIHTENVCLDFKRWQPTRKTSDLQFRVVCVIQKGSTNLHFYTLSFNTMLTEHKTLSSDDWNCLVIKNLTHRIKLFNILSLSKVKVTTKVSRETVISYYVVCPKPPGNFNSP